jgi:hypothetical protein
MGGQPITAVMRTWLSARNPAPSRVSGRGSCIPRRPESVSGRSAECESRFNGDGAKTLESYGQVDPVWALAQQRAIPVEQPLGETLPGLVTTWLYDPDGVTNHFAEIRPRQRPALTQAR